MYNAIACYEKSKIEHGNLIVMVHDYKYDFPTCGKNYQSFNISGFKFDCSLFHSLDILVMLFGDFYCSNQNYSHFNVHPANPLYRT